jgi:hypothetical protein
MSKQRCKFCGSEEVYEEYELRSVYKDSPAHSTEVWTLLSINICAPCSYALEDRIGNTSVSDIQQEKEGKPYEHH